ncbi:hypothetical protein GE061_013877 [Apolygus lucorum]|uniref:Endo-polygalacturonase n=1 Tax=Apolygus lucorum TaxID=248454 RepID=A0A6A4JTL5_APOLU|nr:hypothetical protein GE061_013877 [Apolygus lucorum]
MQNSSILWPVGYAYKGRQQSLLRHLWYRPYQSRFLTVIRMKTSVGAFAGLLLVVAVTSAVDVHNMQQLDAAKRGNDNRIVIRNLQVPAGVQLNLENLKPGTVVQFAGRVTFGYKEWRGPLVKISGKNVRVEGLNGNILDAEGARWWDGKGGSGGKVKPDFIELFRLDNSVVKGLNILNAPHKMVLINFCEHLLIRHMNLDNAAGKGIAFNTDGFCAGINKDIKIRHVTVRNQDDCLCVLATDQILFEEAICIGGNGISIGSMGGGYTVKGLTVRKVQIIDSFNGLRIKTKKNQNALVQDVTWDDVILKDIQQRGIIIHGNYPNWRPTDEPDNKIPIRNLVINNVRGTVQKGGSNVWIWLGNGVASNWRVSNVKVTGGGLNLPCKGIPRGVNMVCG